jgi:hypothetical protein
MGFVENWKKKREQKAREREELEVQQAENREKRRRSQEVLLNLNVEITNAALRETERECCRNLSSHHQSQINRTLAAKARALFLVTTDMIGGARVVNQFLAPHLGGTGEIGDFPILCVYVGAVIKKCADVLATSHREGKYSIKSSAAGIVSASHQEIVVALDTTLASSLRRAEELLSDWKNDPGDYLRRVLVSAVNQYGHDFAGSIATKAMVNLKTNQHIKSLF